jgi:leucyl/phenylalanyl-tRNA--protein transferase
MRIAPVILSERLWFPEAGRAVPMGARAGLVAVGGDLSVSRLLLAYRSGIFPWTINPITWWSPDPRGVFELDGFHVPRSLRPLIRRGVFEITRDRAFRAVMEGCADRRGKFEGTWISRPFIEAYTALHEAGHAHSVECWRDGQLAGGIYGVAVGGLFAGESMFHRVSGASKVALHHLVEHLRARQFSLFDIQMLTPVTRQLGALEIPRSEYLRRLARAVGAACRF